MVRNVTQKAKNKVSSRTPAASSKKASKQTLKAAAVSNGHSDSEEPQNTDIELGLNGAENNVDEAQSEASAKTVDQPVGSEKKNAASDAANVESSETALVEKKLKSGTLSKTKGKQQKKGKENKMEITDEQETTPSDNQQETASDNQEEMAAGVESNTEPVEQSSKTRKRKDANKGDAGDEAIVLEEVQPEPATQPSKTRKRKIEAPKVEIVEPKKSRGRKKVTESMPKTKAKHQKVLLSVPSSQSISGKLFTVGENDVGQLGFDDGTSRRRPAMLELPHSFVDIAAGGMHSVCLTESGEVFTFGCNDEGALGRATSDESEEVTPHKVEISEKVVQISAGDSHTAALTESGQVYICGNFRSGDGPMGLTADGKKQVNPIQILTGRTVVKIASGAEHLACLTNEGTVYTCGCGQNGQLGRIAERFCNDGGRKGRSLLLDPAAVPMGKLNSKPIVIEDIWAGSYTTFLKAKDTGLIYAFGLNNYNHLGFENERVRFLPKQVTSFNDRTWLQITSGQHHTLALDGDGLVYAIGRKDYGRLGLGEECEETSVPTVIPTLEKEKCRNIACGNCVSFSVSDKGSVFSWGMGTNNQLGHGNENDCHVPCLIGGNFFNSWKAFKISGGGQHTMILANPKEKTND